MQILTGTMYTAATRRAAFSVSGSARAISASAVSQKSKKVVGHPKDVIAQDKQEINSKVQVKQAKAAEPSVNVALPQTGRTADATAATLVPEMRKPVSHPKAKPGSVESNSTGNALFNNEKFLEILILLLASRKVASNMKASKNGYSLEEESTALELAKLWQEQINFLCEQPNSAISRAIKETKFPTRLPGILAMVRANAAWITAKDAETRAKKEYRAAVDYHSDERIELGYYHHCAESSVSVAHDA